jgi:hypothetical protein
VRRERRNPSRAEWNAITSKRPVVRKIPPPDKADCLGPNESGAVRSGGKPQTRKATHDMETDGAMPTPGGLQDAPLPKRNGR